MSGACLGSGADVLNVGSNAGARQAENGSTERTFAVVIAGGFALAVTAIAVAITRRMARRLPAPWPCFSE